MDWSLRISSWQNIKKYLQNGLIANWPSVKERIEAVLKHLDLSIKWKGERLGILEMRRHYTNYFRELPEIKKYRSELVQIDKYEELITTINQISKKYANF